MNQDVTYWGRSGVQDDYGNDSFEAPILLKGRWQDIVQEMQKPDGSEFVSKTVVYLPQAVDVGGYLALGDMTAQAEPNTADSQAQEIQQFGSSPDLRNMSTEYRAYL